MNKTREIIAIDRDGEATPTQQFPGKRNQRLSIWRTVLLYIPLFFLVVACSEQTEQSLKHTVSPPQKVAAVGADSEVLLQWNAVDGALGYKIYWNTSADSSVTDTSLSVQNNSATISGLQNESDYYFRLSALSTAGESVASAQIRARPRSAKLASIIVTPEQYVITGTRLYFTAIGVYSDGSQQDISGMAEWHSSDLNIATVAEDGIGAGLVDAVQQGPFVISASFRGVSGWVSTFSQSVPLQEIIIRPHNPQITNGSSLSFQALGLFTQGAANYGYITQDLTATVNWIIENPSIASINNAIGYEGMTQGLNLGESNVSASFDGHTSQSLLRVAPVVLQNIVISPSNPSISLGMTQAFSATGTYSDGSTQDITESLLWNTSDSQIATISNYSNSPTPAGQATTSYWGTTGSTVVSAGLQNVMATTTLTVSEPKIVALSIEPAVATLAPGKQAVFEVYQVYDNGARYYSLQGLFNWTSADSSVATVDANGVATGVTAGLSTTISVTDPLSPDLSASAIVTVANMPANHSAIIANCVDCHDGSVASAKPVLHIPSGNICETCHSAIAWIPAQVDHTQVLGDCVACHDGVSASGKSSAHIASSDVCQACHQPYPLGWIPVPSAAVDHSQVLGTCESCHDGIIARGKSPTHLATNNACDVCHNIIAWIPAQVDHTSLTSNCVSCHDGVSASGKSILHLPSSDLCEACHQVYPAAWIPVAAAAVDHSQVFGSCDSCHDGIIARGKGPTHCPTTAACDTCHSDFSFIPASNCPIL